MSFIDKSTTTSKKVKKGNFNVAQAQKLVNIDLPRTSNQIRGGITDVVGASSIIIGGKKASAITSSVNKTFNSINQTISTVRNTVNTAVNTVRAVKSTIKSIEAAAKSIKGVFGKSNKGLASGVQGNFSDIFADRSSKKDSTVLSKISDPLSKSIIDAKAPIANSFKVDSMSTQSKPITQGVTSKKGSGAPEMTGTVQATLQDRFSNTNTKEGLGKTAETNAKKDKLKGLLSDISGVVKKVNTNVQKAVKVANTVRRTVNTVTATINTVRSAASSLSNDLQRFTGAISGLSKSTGDRDMSGYFQTSSKFSLVNGEGVSVSTNGSGVDASTANAIVTAAKSVGCETTEKFYTSVSEKASVFNATLDIATENGMTAEVNDLLNCSHAKTELGQKAIATAFVTAASSQVTLADTLLAKMILPNKVKTSKITTSLLTNPNLTPKDVPVLSSIMTKLGTSSQEALSLPQISSDAYPVLDTVLLTQMEPAVLDRIMGSKTMSAFLNGTAMIVSDQGTLVYA